MPVLASQVVQAFASLPPYGVILDCTVGGGGHSSLLLNNHPKLRIIGLDQDPDAWLKANQYLASFRYRTRLIKTNFADFVPVEPLSGVLVDLGVSSHQLEVAQRGFSFRFEGPLDMRMNPSKGETAAELVNYLGEKELADLIFSYGEDRFSRRIARRIVQKRPFNSTKDLAYVIAGCYSPKSRRGRIHPATRTFQALRIAVNNEMEVLDHLLSRIPDWLIPGGIVAIISFHSLEDRRVKQAFLTDERLERITNKPLVADENERNDNSRSRSAKLRIAKRTDRFL
uniref:Methyltransferase n=1 Tax=Paulinella chromatophora TaxID=39717 RepID=B1X4A4_PAUCH|nr:methyltransferase [Paulinella chromatophora]ACB42773.1 methyltransferase [Paulinella chromatophora]